MRRPAVLTGPVLVLALVLGACAAPPEVEGGPAYLPTADPRTSLSTPPLRMLDDGFVLDAGDGPMLCEDGVAESHPPQCSGKRIDGWDWSALEHESAAGVRWGSFDLELVDHGTRYERVTAEPSS